MPKLLETLRSRSTKMADIDDRRRLVEGDHWLDGRGWVGPMPIGDNATQVMGLLKKQFVAKNTIAEVCRRHRNALVGKEPIWGFSPRRSLAPNEELTAQEVALKQEAEAALTVWWDKQKVHPAIQEAVMQMLWTKQGVKGVSYLRLYLPLRLLDGDGYERMMPRVTVEEAMEYIQVHAMLPTQGGVISDRDGVPIAGYYNYKDEEDRDFTEVNALARTLAEEGELRDENNYADDDTVVQLRDNSGDIVAEAGYALGGRLLTIELERGETLVTETMVSQQKLLNMAYTMTGRNVVQGGFLERIIANAQLPGKWVDENGNPSDAGTIFKPEPMFVGPGSLNFLTGFPIKNDLGETTGYTNPNVTYKDPVPVTTFRDTLQIAKEAIYEEAAQLYVLLAGDATTSGQSRIQATNDFVASLGESAIPVETAVRDLLETVLTWAAYFANQPRRFESIRADVEANLSAVQPTPDEIRVNIEQYNAGVLSRETTMAKNGVEDVAAEKAKVDAEVEEEVLRREQEIVNRAMNPQVEPGENVDEDGNPIVSDPNAN